MHSLKPRKLRLNNKLRVKGQKPVASYLQDNFPLKCTCHLNYVPTLQPIDIKQIKYIKMKYINYKREWEIHEVVCLLVTNLSNTEIKAYLLSIFCEFWAFI